MQDNISYEELLKLGIAKKEQSGQQQSVKVPFFLRKQVAKLNQQKIPKKKSDIFKKENQYLKSCLPKPPYTLGCG